MKKLFIAMFALTFCIISAQAEGTRHTTDTSAYITQSLANNVSVADILVTLIKGGATLHDAVGEVIKNGGDKHDTLAAALIINPDFSYNDPTHGLSPTASGNEEGQKGDKHADAKKKTSDSEHSGVIALGGGGGASPF